MRKLYYFFAFIGLSLVLSSHDLFIKLDSFFLQENQEYTLQLFNGTFVVSENTVARERMQDARIIGGGQNYSIQPSQWADNDSITTLKFNTTKAGNYVVGVSVMPKMIALSAQDFNDYLKHDGILDILERRTQQGQLQNDAKERYSKHVKAILQVGNTQSDDFKTVLGYPIEFIPLQNPYTLKKGQSIEIQLFTEGTPLANQWVYAGGDFSQEGIDEMQFKTDKDGKFTVPLNYAGRWYIRTIRMIENPEKDIDYESFWATLTFEIR